MPVIQITRFDGGIANDYVRASAGQFSISKHFDVLTYPFRLQPIRGMESRSESVDHDIKQIILGVGGLVYGIGLDNPSNPNNGELYYLDPNGPNVFAAGSQAQLAGTTLNDYNYNFLVHFAEQTATNKVYWSYNNGLVASSVDGSDSISPGQSLTHTFIGQGLVHPKDKTLYFPYTTSTASLIGSIGINASVFGSFTASAFSNISNRFKTYCLSYFDDFLAVPMTVDGQFQESFVGLWDRSASLFTRTIPWGYGDLKVLNNLDGMVVGVLAVGSTDGINLSHEDKAGIQIKVYNGGAEPITVAEILATRLPDSTTRPSVTINHRVNFVQNNRLYFSANIINGDSNANYYGLFSVGRNKLGNWTVVLERLATNDASDTGILAAILQGDNMVCIHTSAGTVTYTINSANPSYSATSVYETEINPDMPETDKRKQKVLQGVYVRTMPLPTAGQVVVKYRVDSSKDDAWSYTVISGTTDNEVLFEAIQHTDGSKLKKFKNIEFRIESTGGASIIEWGYKYDTEDSKI